MSIAAVALIALPMAWAADVVVLGEDVAPGTVLSSRHLEVRYVNKALTEGNTFSSTGSALGRVAKSWLYEGEVLRGERLGPRGVRGPEAMIEDGEAVVRVEVDAPAAWVPLGQRVDLLVHHDDYACRAVDAARVLTATVEDGRAVEAALAVPADLLPDDGMRAGLSVRSPLANWLGERPPTCDGEPPEPVPIPMSVGRSYLFEVPLEAASVEMQRFGIATADRHQSTVHVVGLSEGIAKMVVETPWGPDTRAFEVVPAAEWEASDDFQARERLTIHVGGGALVSGRATWMGVADPEVVEVIAVEGGLVEAGVPLHERDLWLIRGLEPGATDVVLGVEADEYYNPEEMVSLWDVVVEPVYRKRSHGPNIRKPGGKFKFLLPQPPESFHVVDPEVVTATLKKAGMELQVQALEVGYTEVLVTFPGDPKQHPYGVIVGEAETVEWVD